MDSSPAFDTLPLRQRKFALTKLGLLEAALRALESRSLESVTVRELCEAASISEASFFNYFPRKSDLLVYYVQLWSLEMDWLAKRLASTCGGIAAIEEIFIRTGRRVREHPGIMAEIIAGQLRMREPPRLMDISLAERLLAFPRMPGIEEATDAGIHALLPPLLEQAVARGELPRWTDREAALTSLASIFFGVPVVHHQQDTGQVEGAYLTLLRLLWSGLGSIPEPDSRCPPED